VLLTSCFPIANLDFIFPFSVTAELFVRVGVQKTFLSVGTPFSTFYFVLFVVGLPCLCWWILEELVAKRMLENLLNRIKVAPCSFWLQCLNGHKVERELGNCPGTC